MNNTAYDNAQCGWPEGRRQLYEVTLDPKLLIAHYRGENGRKFVVTNKQREKIDGFEQTSCKKWHAFKSKPRSATPTTDRRRARIRSRTYERQKRAPSANARTIVRREHQAHCAHPAVGITSTEPGGLARPRKTKLNEYKTKRFGKGYRIFA